MATDKQTEDNSSSKLESERVAQALRAQIEDIGAGYRDLVARGTLTPDEASQLFTPLALGLIGPPAPQLGKVAVSSSGRSQRADVGASSAALRIRHCARPTGLPARWVLSVARTGGSGRAVAYAVPAAHQSTYEALGGPPSRLCPPSSSSAAR